MSTLSTDPVHTPTPPRAFTRRLAVTGLSAQETSVLPVTEDQLADLPSAGVRYAEAMGVLGRPRTWSLCAHLVSRVRRREGGPWTHADTWQFNTADPVTRLVRSRVRLAGLVPVEVWDTYRGEPRHAIEAHSGSVSVADGAGPELVRNHLESWLEDAVLMAPAMLLHRWIGWEDLGEDRFAVSVTDGGRSAAVVVALDGLGHPLELWTQDRWVVQPGGPARTSCSTVPCGWVVADGRPRVVGSTATWHLPRGDVTSVSTEVAALALDVPPGR
ncbi:DUF6544 family protein [Geodermatophilus nigrescens]